MSCGGRGSNVVLDDATWPDTCLNRNCKCEPIAALARATSIDRTVGVRAPGPSVLAPTRRPPFCFCPPFAHAQRAQMRRLRSPSPSVSKHRTPTPRLAAPLRISSPARKMAGSGEAGECAGEFDGRKCVLGCTQVPDPGREGGQWKEGRARLVSLRRSAAARWGPRWRTYSPPCSGSSPAGAGAGAGVTKSCCVLVFVIGLPWSAPPPPPCRPSPRRGRRWPLWVGAAEARCGGGKVKAQCHPR